MKILITGSAGFIGFHLARKLIALGHDVIGIDNFNDYYDPKLKEDRNRILENYMNFRLYRGDLKDPEFIRKVLNEEKIEKIVNLAAQPGVRYSLINPSAYIQSNIVGFSNLIEETRKAGIKDFIYASSSSVYGNNKKIPFSVTDEVNLPASLYAATKRSNELIAYTYHHLYQMNCIGLRFFTVYGPYGRPDMTPVLFPMQIKKGEVIKVFNYGKCRRDFTYVDDIIKGIIACLDKQFGYELFNLGNNKPVELEYFISLIEKEMDKTAEKELLPLQPGDVVETYADIEHTKEKLSWQPETSIEDGIKETIAWFKEYYN